MNSTLSEDVKNVVIKYLLQNAIKYDGKPNPKSIMGKMLGENPDLRKLAKDINQNISAIAKEVEDMGLEAQKQKLSEIAPEMMGEKKERKKKEIELKNVDTKKGVVMRFAPNPSGPLHLGHARASVLNDFFTKKYDGKLILRLEDTDAKRVLPEAYEMIQEDLKWLGVKVDEVVIQSQRLETYYEYGTKLIEMGHAYVCDCDAEEFRELKAEGIACKCRDNSSEKNLELWNKMLSGELDNVAVRLKTDIAHKNPSVRDFPIFRIEHTSHPKNGTKYVVYPLMNLSVTVDDHLMGLTHVLRGKDHIVNTEKQKYIFDYMGWEIPEYLHYGILKIEGPVLSTSKMHAGILEGEYSDWNDPRLGTLRAMRKRGIKPEAIYKTMVDIGIKQADVRFAWENLYAVNKDLIDAITKRFFFVANPKKVIVTGADNKTVELRMHPDKDMGMRTLTFDGEIYLSGTDNVEAGKMYRLMELFNIVIDEVSENVVYAHFDSEDYKVAKENRANIIHWVPVKDSVKVSVIDGDGIETEGYAEKDFAVVKEDESVQFERYGFVRIDKNELDSDVNKVTCYLTHN
ncbi:glutamyl-tRNA synthetase [Methanococcus voltae]|uniref:Glutamate--tRNA ligase n=1 Tax=Methanococcus voltae TaxID=2188 RepID=A0A8J7UU44_METVO|nr:glutamate--tRNA ligase [Methanococcus voltae]MBP2200956.1 glutamyl-tRNA synthetase [Methanococcus voltae]